MLLIIAISNAETQLKQAFSIHFTENDIFLPSGNNYCSFGHIRIAVLRIAAPSYIVEYI